MSLAALQTSAVKVKFQSVWNQSIEPAVEHPCLQLSAALGHSNTLLHTLRATIHKVSYDNAHTTVTSQHACVLQSNTEYFLHSALIKPTPLLTNCTLVTPYPVKPNTHELCFEAAERAHTHTDTHSDTCRKEPCPRFSRNNPMLRLWSSLLLSGLRKSLTAQCVELVK